MNNIYGKYYNSPTIFAAHGVADCWLVERGCSMDESRASQLALGLHVAGVGFRNGRDVSSDGVLVLLECERRKSAWDDASLRTLGPSQTHVGAVGFCRNRPRSICKGE